LLPSSSLPPFPLPAAIPPYMATLSPSPSLHLSDVELPGEPLDPVHAEPAALLTVSIKREGGRRKVAKTN
jgi:hypothetical protein